MVGVSNPMWRYDRHGAVRFLAGHATGWGIASVALILVLEMLSALAEPLHSGEGGRIVLIAVLLGLAAADAIGRTPQVFRQTPQRLVTQLPPGRLGLVFGIDLGLLVTTRKATSLLWATLMAAVLLPAAPIAALVALGASVAVIGLVVQTFYSGSNLLQNVQSQHRLVITNAARRISSALLVSATLVLILS
jgi:hypothetical protein